MQALFEPKGDVAEWRLVYERIRKLKPDEQITHAELSEILERPFENNRGPLYRAQRELERNQHRTLATINGVGYRIAHPREHLGLSLAHSERARHDLQRGVEVASAADRTHLDTVTAGRLEAAEATMSRLVDFLGHMGKRVDEHSEQIADLTDEHEDAAARISALEETLRRHGLD